MKSHITVLKEEAVKHLSLTPKSTVIDATFGSGGHAALILSILKQQGTYFGLDADPDAIEAGKESLGVHEATVHLVNENFRNITEVANTLGITHVDAILADLGWRMEQFSGSGKGFSFLVDEPLIMTYGNKENYLFTARDIVNSWDEEHISDVLRGYGEERFSGRIARAIVEARSIKPIETSTQLAAVIENVVPAFYRRGRINPATKTFQALRIAVNDELGALKAFIDGAYELLEDGGRMAVITFHSIEDRIVKQRFREIEHDHGGVRITKKPIVPTKEALADNPRARSAKLRVLEKHHGTHTVDSTL
jgi:16S rRNA (cytosine1402-N4)-methyltransferase